jgi:hypothetical protein
MEKARQFLIDNPDLCSEIEKALKGKLVPRTAGSEPGGLDEGESDGDKAPAKQPSRP